MTSPAWYNEEKKLKEGDVLSFSYIRLIQLSDGEDYMVFEDPFGIRHMVPYSYYRKYPVQPGMEIVCRVDRINCTGRVFLEPEHPFYTSGKNAAFSVISVENISAARDIVRITVIDIFGNEIFTEINKPSATEIKAGEMIEFRVETVLKGKPVLICV